MWWRGNAAFCTFLITIPFRLPVLVPSFFALCAILSSFLPCSLSRPFFLALCVGQSYSQRQRMAFFMLIHGIPCVLPPQHRAWPHQPAPQLMLHMLRLPHPLLFVWTCLFLSPVLRMLHRLHVVLSLRVLPNVPRIVRLRVPVNQRFSIPCH